MYLFQMIFFAQHTTPVIFRSLDFGWEKLLKNNL